MFQNLYTTSQRFGHTRFIIYISLFLRHFKDKCNGHLMVSELYCIIEHVFFRSHGGAVGSFVLHSSRVLSQAQVTICYCFSMKADRMKVKSVVFFMLSLSAWVFSTSLK